MEIMHDQSTCIVANVEISIVLLTYPFRTVSVPKSAQKVKPSPTYFIGFPSQSDKLSRSNSVRNVNTIKDRFHVYMNTDFHLVRSLPPNGSPRLPSEKNMSLDHL